MRSAFFVSGFLLSLMTFIAAQDSVDDARRRMTERPNPGSTGSFVTPVQPRPQTIVSYVTYLSKEREWADLNGRKMTGRLVAFAAPEPGKSGPVVVVEEGKVRLRRTGANANSDLPIDQLSQADQLFVKAVEAGIKKNSVPGKEAD